MKIILHQSFNMIKPPVTKTTLGRAVARAFRFSNVCTWTDHMQILSYADGRLV